MATQNSRAVPQLEAKNTVLTTANAALSSELVETKERLSSQTDRAATAVVERDRARKQAEDLTNQVARLKDELHQMTVEKARLEGYIDRARESDPPPQPVMVPAPRPDRSGYDPYGYDYQRDSNVPWYRR